MENKVADDTKTPLTPEQLAIWLAGAVSMVPEGEGLSVEQVAALRTRLDPVVAKIVAKQLVGDTVRRSLEEEIAALEKERFYQLERKKMQALDQLFRPGTVSVSSRPQRF